MLSTPHNDVSAIANRNEAAVTADVGEPWQQFLSFQVGADNTLLLPAELVIEVRRVRPAEILPVPGLPGCVLGAYQWRNKSLWTLDLGDVLEMEPLAWTGSNFLFVLKVREQAIALVVSRVHGIQSYDCRSLHLPTPDRFSPKLLPLFDGFFHSADGDIHALLNPEAIARVELYALQYQ